MKRQTTDKKVLQRIRRHHRVRKNLKGTSLMPRLSVFRSNKSLYVQLIDDVKGATIVAATDLKSVSKSKVEKAKELGNMLAKSALAKKIGKIVFDRSGYTYHGRVKSLAEGAREGGLKF